eukprot:gnl/Trimastix_PCT/2712.p2 GENE.gnl/Trimastix_PCT/2712~~gnl/Trimastix_PCT/2712.p2  ORF type:complete len:145 (-),score=32.88 gnl/Trimastix_PCT/2712:16-450(-)
MKYFLAGVIQGNNQGQGMESQDYRTQLQEIIQMHDPTAEILDPWDLTPGMEPPTTTDRIRYVFEENVRRAANDADIVVAFVPHASMGTSIEMYEAWRKGKRVYCITPLKTNWVCRLYTSRLFESIEEFGDFMGSTSLPALPAAQ